MKQDSSVRVRVFFSISKMGPSRSYSLRMKAVLTRTLIKGGCAFGVGRLGVAGAAGRRLP